MFNYVQQDLLFSIVLCITMQTTFFGKVKSNDPFFINVDANSTSVYYAIIDLLWQQSSVTDCKEFLKAAQQQLTENYQGDHEEERHC